MRSDEVYKAASQIENRYLLCSVVRASARRMHRAGTPLQGTISQVLGLMNGDFYRLQDVEDTVPPSAFSQTKTPAKGAGKVPTADHSELERAG